MCNGSILLLMKSRVKLPLISMGEESDPHSESWPLQCHALHFRGKNPIHSVLYQGLKKILTIAVYRISFVEEESAVWNHLPCLRPVHIICEPFLLNALKGEV